MTSRFCCHFDSACIEGSGVLRHWSVFRFASFLYYIGDIASFPLYEILDLTTVLALKLFILIRYCFSFVFISQSIVKSNSIWPIWIDVTILFKQWSRKNVNFSLGMRYLFIIKRMVLVLVPVTLSSIKCHWIY